ncbi:MAG: cbb3-type cytochrome oxidase assembly protein CcoS [Rhodanobacter sp.]|nr:MAG: cbb3-type cytochrome oxidase assembly protein CcoS [Rhodanobacter sp.]
MNILLVLIPVTLLVVVIAVVIFFWAVNHQQFDDLDSPAILPLLDDPDQGGQTATPLTSRASRFPTPEENRYDPPMVCTCPTQPPRRPDLGGDLLDHDPGQ